MVVEVVTKLEIVSWWCGGWLRIAVVGETLVGMYRSTHLVIGKSRSLTG